MDRRTILFGFGVALRGTVPARAQSGSPDGGRVDAADGEGGFRVEAGETLRAGSGGTYEYERGIENHGTVENRGTVRTGGSP